MAVTIPEAVRAGVEAALSGRAGHAVRLTGASPLGGGCVSPAARVETDTGQIAFLKWGAADTDAPGRVREGAGVAGIFPSEADALRALADAGAVRVPAVLGVSPTGVVAPRRDVGSATADARVAWLLLEWLEPGPATAESWRRLGRGLSAMHRTRAERYGWPSDNYIGPLPQANGSLDSWPTFWRERRLLPQLERALDRGHFTTPSDRRRFDRLLDRLDELLAGAAADGASLLHGDLWSGNVHVLADGWPALIDPSSYYGHREVDLAMSELFGGFGAEFYRAYDEEWPVPEEYGSVRRPVYQLYYLLVHVNLFGGGYVGRTLAALAEAGV